MLRYSVTLLVVVKTSLARGSDGPLHEVPKVSHG